MSPRARRPTDEAVTELRDPDRLPLRIGVRPGDGAVELATPTQLDPRRPIEQGTPTAIAARPERSEPIRVISMKERTTAQLARAEEQRVPLHVQLRSMAEVAGRHDTPAGLGHLAPPRDGREVRARHARANLVWVCAGIVLACAISLAIWFVAGR
jgi:hypothetical protein